MRQREWVRGEEVGGGRKAALNGAGRCARKKILEWAMMCGAVVLGAVALGGCRVEKGGGGETGASGGGGTGVRRNLAELAKGPQVRVAPANGVFEPVTEPELPSRPTTGSRKEVAGRVAKEALPIRPCEIAIFPCAFDGVTQANCETKTGTTTSCGGQPPDMNWAFTDSMAGTPTTAVFAAGDANGPLVAIAGAGTPFTSGGGVTSQTRFGDFSSVSVDPNVSGCAFATQQYFATDGGWKTRVAPIRTCESIVVK